MLICRGKSVGSVIRVLWGPGWTRLAFSRRPQVLPRRGHGLRPPSGWLARGPKTRPWAPSRDPRKVRFAGEKSLGSAIRAPFGVRNGLVCLFFAAARSTARRGHGLRTQRGDRGATIAPLRPHYFPPPQSDKSLQIGLQSCPGCGVALLWGAKISGSAHLS
jgi:hypothetical protein